MTGTSERPTPCEVDEDLGGEAPCFAHLLEDDSRDDDQPSPAEP